MCNCNENNVGKSLLLLAGGVAIGAALGILFAPAKGAATRRKIASTTRNLKDNLVGKLETLVESAEELIGDFKENIEEKTT
ncbi:MAG: YtxH domain-containing protein [Prevotellaceae bacterium]|nr:YtxH domain-containing protein [Prevotellaceae bacterium]